MIHVIRNRPGGRGQPDRRGGAEAPIMRSISANLFVRHGGGEARRRACGARTPRQDRRAGDSRAATPACG
jgi:hypothetical protein